MEEPGEEAAGPEASFEQLRRERDEARERWMRAAAELENDRKRLRREAEADAFEARTSLLRAMLPIADNLERALQHAVGEDPVAMGVRLVHQQLLTALADRGVTRFVPLDERFDPRRHDAIDQLETNEAPPGTVVRVLAPGYLLDGRLLRPAQVTVSRALPAHERERRSRE
jgi:molecular chaperone GrpE